jgi:hypothetical protein
MAGSPRSILLAIAALATVFRLGFGMFATLTAFPPLGSRRTRSV